MCTSMLANWGGEAICRKQGTGDREWDKIASQLCQIVLIIQYVIYHSKNKSLFGRDKGKAKFSHV